MTDAEHAQIVAAALTDAGFTVLRDVKREPGEFAMLVQPPRPKEDLQTVREIVAGAGYAFTDGSPTWLKLRKLVLVSCVGPEA